jgi:hypothetical protein
MPKAERKKKAGTEKRERISKRPIRARLGVGFESAAEPT